MKISEQNRQGKVISSSVRKINRNLVFRYLYSHPGLSKQELSKALNLSLPTLSQNLNELLEGGLISNSETKESTGGRRAHSINLRSEARFALGLDITANHLSGVVINLLGETVASNRIRRPFSGDETYFVEMADFIEDLIEDARIERGLLLGVGLAVPAIVSEDGEQLTYASLLNFTHGRLEDFSRHIPYPCRFVNDADAAGFAEYWSNSETAAGGERSGQGIVYLMVSNSVGGAFFIDGKGYKGRNMRANEFGHITLHPYGKRCYCGQLGCADAYLSTKQLSDLFDGSLPDFFDALERGDAAAASLWQEYKQDLALLINSLRMAYDCKVVLGGYLGSCIGSRLKEVRKLLAERNHFDSDGDYLIPCLYRREASAVGAGLSFINDLLLSV